MTDQDTSPFDRPAITGAILAGGLARRMGGEDKGLLLARGRPLVEYVLERLRPQVDHILINANRNPEAYAAYGHPVVRDRITGFPGPVAGIVTVLEASTTDWVVTVPCDCPLLPTDLVDRLWGAIPDENCRAVTAHDGQRLQPSFSLIHRSLAASAREWLHQGHRRLEEWLLAQEPAVALFDETPVVFTNVNTPQDLVQLELWVS